MAYYRQRIHSIRGSDKLYNPYVGKGEVLFTGPDSISNHNVTVCEPTYVGLGTMSPEGTSNLEYIWRPGQRWAFPPPKSVKVGEIGWGLNLFHDIKRLQSGKQIMMGEFRQESEDRHSHLYQNPWYPTRPQLGRFNNQQANRFRQRGYSRESQGPSCQQGPGAFRSFTPTPKTVHFDDTSSGFRPQSCSPNITSITKIRSESTCSSSSSQSRSHNR